MKNFFILLFVTLPLLTQAQAINFERVQQILEAKCATCHSSTSPGLKLVGTMDQVYNNIVDKTPNNPVASAKGQKLVYPSYPERSFLYRKINKGLYADCTALESTEGSSMPTNGTPLTNTETEIIRQWIMHGASKTESYAQTDEAAIDEWYTEGGLPRVEPLSPLNPSEGYQVYFGTLFLKPGQEIELHKKVELKADAAAEIYKIENRTNAYSHHVVLNKLDADWKDECPQEIKYVTQVFDEVDYFLHSSLTFISQYESVTFNLPQGTAYRWEEHPALDVNFHIKNYSTDKILPAELYINFYTQPMGTAQHQMKGGLAVHGEQNPFILSLPPTGKDTVVITEQYNPTADENARLKIWVLQAHTHKLGKAYNIYKRNLDGSKGELIYDGNYNSDYTVNQGYFDWAHPAIRTMDPQIEINPREGIIHEATFNNSTGQTVNFGLTTANEMFITYYLYTEDTLATAAPTINPLKNNTLTIAPNPITTHATVTYELTNASNVTVQLFDLTGKLIKTLALNELQQTGSHTLPIKNFDNLPSGMYLLRLQTGKFVETQKINKL